MSNLRDILFALVFISLLPGTLILMGIYHEKTTNKPEVVRECLSAGYTQEDMKAYGDISIAEFCLRHY